MVDPTPVRVPYRRVPPHLVTEVKSLLQGLLEQGLIRRSSSNYASAVVLVKKKSGALRLCIDYRQLNAKCLRDAIPLLTPVDKDKVLGSGDGASPVKEMKNSDRFVGLLCKPKTLHARHVRMSVQCSTDQWQYR